MFFLPFSILLLLALLFILLPLFLLLLQIELVRVALGRIGLSPAAAFFILLGSLAGSAVNIPVCIRRVPGAAGLPDCFFLLAPFGLPEVAGRQIIAVNLGGCVIPLLLCLYLLPRTPFLPVFFATAISTVVCFNLSRVVPGIGVQIPAFIPPIVSVALAWLFSPCNKIPVAYISGVLGVLIGADILNLPSLGTVPGVMSIGGAGVYDGIFLVGIISALLA